jgi:ATP-binding cassette subfamily B protein
MVITKRKYGILDIFRIPLECAPVLGTLVGIQILISGIIPTIQVVVTADFIDTALSIVKDKAATNLIYPPLLAVVALIAYSWISGALVKFAEVNLELSIREKFRTAVTEKRASFYTST